MKPEDLTKLTRLYGTDHGKFDAAVFNPNQNNWYVFGSTAGITINGFGSNGDQPVPNAFVP
jgi:hypothetical protein